MTKLLSILLVCLALAANARAAVTVGSKAPAVNAKQWINADGDVSLDNFKDKVVVVEFWSTWCSPCLKSIPHLVELYNKNKDKGLFVIGLTSEDRKSGKIDEFVEKMNMNYIVGTGSTSGRDYGVRGIPRAFVVGPDGKIQWMGHPMSGLDKAVDQALKTLSSQVEKEKRKPEEKKAEKKVTPGKPVALKKEMEPGKPGEADDEPQEFWD